MRKELKTLIEQWAFDIPVERAVRLSLVRLENLLEQGLTWKSIADALTAAGARHKNGHPISPRQINTVCLRIQRANRTLLTENECRRERERDLTTAATGSITFAKSDVGQSDSFTKARSASIPAVRLGERLTEARRMRDAVKSEYDD